MKEFRHVRVLPIQYLGSFILLAKFLAD